MQSPMTWGHLKRASGVAMLAATAVACAPRPAASPLQPVPHTDSWVDSVLGGMSLEEKLGQLNLLSVGGEGPTDAQRDLVRRGLVGGFLNLVGAAAARDIQRIAVGESRLRIPLLLGYDVIHGHRTTFPIPLAEASTWDPDLVEQTARVAAREAAAAGVNWTFAPMVDIARDPRWGRIAEGSGEDPYLGALLAAARVRGFQGTSLRDSNAVLATAKHFAAYGAAEAGRDYNTVDVSERTLREVYLPPFKAAVDAGAGTIMTAFNEIAGVPATASRWLLTDVLRGEWRFDGLVVSDWTAIDELRAHGVAASRAEAGRLALEAGVDMDMESRIYVEDLPALVRSGRVSTSLVDSAVARVLRTKRRLGLFDSPDRGATPERERAVLLAPAHRALARRVAQQAMVLLKNERGILPLGEGVRTIAVIGPLAADTVHPRGPWHAQGRAADVVSVLEGVRRRAGPGRTVLHAAGTGLTDTATSGIAPAVALARRADVTLLVLGETDTLSGEASSRTDLGLPGAQEQLLRAVTETGKPVVLILMNGRPLVLTRTAESVSAILETWFLGVESGNALADVVFGDVNPSGRLPVSFPRSVGQVPLYYNHKSTGRPPAESRFTSKYLDAPVTPLYPFGFGLTYTTFAYTDLRVSAERIARGDTLRVSVSVRNTGTRPGVEVIQLYLRDDVASVTRPVRELRGFRRVTLEPGAVETVEFRLVPDDFALYGPDWRRVVEPGTFRIFVGPNAMAGLEAQVEVLP
jgi:beta-glucosidase